MTIRTRSELDEALLRVFVEALADEPVDVADSAHTPDAVPDMRTTEEPEGRLPGDSALERAA